MIEELNKYSEIKFNKDYSELSENEKLEITSICSEALLEKYTGETVESREIDKNNVNFDNKFVLISKPYKLKKNNGIIFIVAFLILGPIINFIYVNFFGYTTNILQLSILFLIVATLITMFIIIVSRNNIVILDNGIQIGKNIIKYNDMSSIYNIPNKAHNNTQGGIHIVTYNEKKYRASTMLYNDVDINELCNFLNNKIKNL